MERLKLFEKLFKMLLWRCNQNDGRGGTHRHARLLMFYKDVHES